MAPTKPIIGHEYNRWSRGNRGLYLIRKPRETSETSTNTALLASQNRNIAPRIKIALEFKNGSITDILASNSD